MTSTLTGARRPALATLTTVLTLALAGPAAAADVAADEPAETAAAPAGQITLDVQTVNGSGCSAGTASVSMLSGNTGFRVTYRNFIAEAGGRADPTDFRKNCQVNLVVHIPQGFTFAVARADYRGRARLADGATGLHRTNYYFQGSSDNNYVDHKFAGPLNAVWHSTESTPVSELVFAPCGASRSLNVNTELRVDEGTKNPGTTSSMSMRSSEGNVDTLIHFQWKNC